MEIRKNRIYRSWLSLILCGALLVQGCATTHKSDSYPPSSDNQPFSGGPESYGPPEPVAMGPFPDERSPESKDSYGPSPVKVKPVVLVLGPGLAKGFAYVGVIRALIEAKIPIGAILGTEMGGLIGSLYAFSTNLNQFDWSLLKFKSEIFEAKKGFLGKKRVDQSNGAAFESKLREVFQTKDLAQAKIPLFLSIQSKKSGVLTVVHQGNAVRAVRAAMASPRIFTPGVWSEFAQPQAVSAEDQRPFLVREARELRLGPVIAVDVFASVEKVKNDEELAQADLVIHPSLQGISALDFSKRTEAAYQGKAAVAEHLGEIKKLVGWSSVESRLE